MPVKRRMGVDPSNIIDGTRGKRRREDSEPQVGVSGSSADMKVDDTLNISTESNESDATSVKEKGFQIWNALKEARGKDEHQLAYEFMKLPSKRQYPDYYILIKRPICLDDIKSKLDAGRYSSLEAVKHDFDTCFKNAKRYNQRESVIWKDAKTLQKLTSKEYEQLIGADEPKADNETTLFNGAEEGSEEDEGDDKKKKKPQSLTRVLKNRLVKLTEKTDDGGRVLSWNFMELPDKKQYPDYYQIIKKVMCFDTVFRKIKRKEYVDAAQFATDVETIFSNAFHYNLEHSPIWEDALILKEYFRKLMTTIPAEYSVASYLDNGTGGAAKIKLKLHTRPTVSSPIKSDSPPVAEAAGNPSGITVKLPAVNLAPPSSDAVSSFHEPTSQDVTGSAPIPTPPSTSSTGPLPPAPQAPRNGLPTKSTTQSANDVSRAPSQDRAYSQAALPVLQAKSQTQPPSQSPAPPNLDLKFPIQTLIFRTVPKGRTFQLDREEGVKIWSVRLGVGERGLRVNHVDFVSEKADGMPSSEEENEDDVTTRRKLGENEKAKTGLRDREGDKNGADGVVKKSGLEAIVRLNGSILKNSSKGSSNGSMDEWAAELPIGPSILEVMGDRAGEVWKVYLERQTGM